MSNVTSLRMRVLPGLPSRVSGTDGLSVNRDGLDFVVRPDFGVLTPVPSIQAPEATFFQAFNEPDDSYSKITFQNLVENIQDVVIGPTTAAMEATTPSAGDLIYFVGPDAAALKPITDFADADQGARADEAYALEAPVVLDSTSLSAALKSRFDDVFTLSGFVNATFDGVSTPVDNHDVLASVLTEAQGRRFVLPRGNAYVETDLPIGGNGKPFSMDGNTGLGALVFGAACTRGLRVDQPDYVTPVSFTDMTVFTLGQENGAAFAIILPAPDGNKPINDPRTGFWGRTIAKGWDNNQHGWAKGVYVENCHSIPVERLTALGRQNTALTTMARFTNMTNGLHAEHTGSFIGGAPRMGPANIVGAQQAVLVNGRSEGGSFSYPYLEAVLDGLLVTNPDAGDRPGFEVLGGHINSARRSIYLKNIANAIIGNVQFFKFEYAKADGTIPMADGIDSAGETVHIVLDSCELITVLPNVFNLGAGTPAVNGENTGIRLLNSGFCDIHKQQGIYVTTGVSIKGASANNRIETPKLDGDFSSVARPTKPVRNEATGSPASNLIRGSEPVRKATNPSAVTTPATSSFAEVLRLDLGRCEAGEVYDITISVEVQKGGTAGLSLFQLITSEGGTDFNGKGALLSRMNQAANATDVGNETAVMSVATSGQKTLILQGLATGSAASTPAPGTPGNLSIAAIRR